MSCLDKGAPVVSPPFTSDPFFSLKNLADFASKGRKSLADHPKRLNEAWMKAGRSLGLRLLTKLSSSTTS